MDCIEYENTFFGFQSATVQYKLSPFYPILFFTNRCWELLFIWLMILVEWAAQVRTGINTWGLVVAVAGRGESAE